MGSDQQVIPPPPDGSGIIPVNAPPALPGSASIPPPPDGSGIVAAPARIAAAAQAPKRGIVSGIGNAISNWWGQTNPMGIVRSMADLVPREPVDFLVNRGIRDAYRSARDLVTSGAEDIGAGDTASGIRKIGSGLIPFIGPSLNQAGEQVAQGDYSGALGTTAGIATNLFGPQILAKTPIPRGIRTGIQGTADRIYRIGTSPMSPETARFGTTEGIPQDASGIAKAEQLSNAIGQRIGGPIRSAPQSPTINPGPVVQNLQDLRREYLPSEQAPISAAQQEFTDQLRSQPGGPVRNMTPAEAFDLKIKYQDAAQRARRNAYALGEIGGAGVESKKMIASSLGDQLVSQFPEITDPNIRYGLSKDLIPEIERIVDKEARRNPFRSLATMSGVVTGVATGRPVTGLLASAAMEIAANPALRSRFAIALSKASRIPISEASARLTGYLNAAGQSSGTAEEPTPQGAQ